MLQHSTKSEPWDGFLAAPDVFAPSDTAALEGRRILITGAGGYIGTALAHALASFAGVELVLLDIAEHGLFLLDQILQCNRRLIVGSVCDQALVNEVLMQHKPEIIFHAAALKHVPLMESNPIAAAATNALGTSIVLQAAAEQHAQQCILISTDKAVEPVSMMGATKRIAERIVLEHAAAPARPSALVTKILRLCNVLGSSGSVAPLFARQLKQKRPITVTDKEATRYFVSLEQAVALLIECASTLYRSGLYIPRVASPYRIDDLAHYLMGATSGGSGFYPTDYIGLRAGEKLHERMTYPREVVVEQPLEAPLLKIENAYRDAAPMDQPLNQLRSAVAHRDPTLLLHAIEQLVPEYVAGSLLRALAGEKQAR